MNDNLFYVFQVHPGNDQPQHVLLGKFYLKDGVVQVLEDHGLNPGGTDLADMSPKDAAKFIRRLSTSQRRKIVSAKQLTEGQYPELLPSAPRTRSMSRDLKEAMEDQLSEKTPGPRMSTFDYHREGMPSPQTLKVAGSKAFLDDSPLNTEELAAVMGNIREGRGTLRHRVGGLAKSEDLAKMEPGLSAALEHMRNAVRLGQVQPQALETLQRHLFSDTMVPVMGNKAAYADFLARPKPGVHIHLDANQFKNVNEKFGHEVGNQAITSMGNAIRSALDESVGRKHAKSFRSGGDEFIAHVPTHEHAARFARALRSKLDAIPAIQGQHRLSTSMGWGPTPEHAEAALMDAKAAKNAAGYAPGQAKNHAAAHMPELTGNVPVE
jgi:diguanylate cyclase (GGDEF)-like protein